MMLHEEVTVEFEKKAVVGGRQNVDIRWGEARVPEIIPSLTKTPPAVLGWERYSQFFTKRGAKLYPQRISRVLNSAELKSQ